MNSNTCGARPDAAAAPPTPLYHMSRSTIMTSPIHTSVFLVPLFAGGARPPWRRSPPCPLISITKRMPECVPPSPMNPSHPAALSSTCARKAKLLFSPLEIDVSQCTQRDIHAPCARSICARCSLASHMCAHYFVPDVFLPSCVCVCVPPTVLADVCDAHTRPISNGVMHRRQTDGEMTDA